MSKFLKCLIFVALIAFPCAAGAEAAPQGCNDHFLAGEMPNVSRNRIPKTQLLCFTEYALLHSGLTKTAIWSAEHLTSDRVEAAEALTKRPNNFHAELRLAPAERAELSDYKGSGFDRGHMSPSGDMSTLPSRRESFSLGNMIPQDPCSNEEQWEGIESSVRQLATGNDEIYVVTGPIYPSNAELKQMGTGVIIPPQIFKAIYVPSLDEAAAYVVPNTAAKEWKAVSIDDLKVLIDVDVFPKLRATVKAKALELPPPQPPKFRCRVHNG
jgi:endonuclease G